MDPITSFEKARLIGVRATHLSQGSDPLVKIKKGEEYNCLKIAEREYFLGVIPLCVVRTLPDGRKIRLKVKPNN